MEMVKFERKRYCDHHKLTKKPDKFRKNEDLCTPSNKMRLNRMPRLQQSTSWTEN